MAQSIWILWLLLLALLVAAILYGLYLSTREPSRENDREIWLEYDSGNFSDGGNIRLTSIPRDEILIPVRYFLVGSTNAQVEYLVIPGHLVTLRAAPAGQLRIPQAYLDEDYQSTSTYDVEGTQVTHRASPSQKVLFTWTRNQFDYAIYSPEPEMNLMGGIIDDFVLGANAEAA